MSSSQGSSSITPSLLPGGKPKDLSSYKISPPLPTLWSDYEVPAALLSSANSKSPAELQAIYDEAVRDLKTPLSDDRDTVMPTSHLGGTTVVPALTLGGPPFLFGMAFRTNRKLFGCVPPAAFLPLNLVVLPLGVVGACCATLPGAYGWAAGLVGAFAWVSLAGGLAVWEQTRYSTRIMRAALARGINHVETARHYLTSEAYLRPVLRNVGRDRVVLQTKVRPYAGGKGFLET